MLCLGAIFIKIQKLGEQCFANANPGLAFYLIADPGPGIQTNADPDLGQT
jgi:hypothetical protein